MHKILKLSGIFLAFALVGAAGTAAWMSFHRPGLEEYAAHRYVSPPAGERSLTATWLGTTAVLLSDGEHSLMVDPFFTRPQGWWRLITNRPIAPDEETIARGLSSARLANLAAVLVSHSHYDHAMDAAVVARLSGAVLAGSESTANIGRGDGLPDSQIHVIKTGEPMNFGSFTVTFIQSRHAGATGGRPTGDITGPLKPPARYLDYKQGGTYSILVEHELGSVLLHGSAGFVPGALAGTKADVVFLGIALRDDLETYLEEVVDAVGAKRVIPTHWDDFTRSMSRPLIPNIAGVNLRDFFADMARSRPDLQVQTLELGEPANLFPPAKPDAGWDEAMNAVAKTYVELVLAVGEHDDGYVDAYYGPAEWRERVKADQKPLTAIRVDTEALLAQLRKLDAARFEELIRLRHRYLLRHLEAMSSHVARLMGEKFSFNEEARRLYDVTPPAYVEADFEPTLARIEKLLPPGEGTLSDRYNRYLESFAIPPAKIEAVMKLAIAEARARTQKHIALPEGESFELRLVKDKSWSAYNWYQGNYRSLIEINTDLPLTASRVIDLAVHEGYPGHHVYNSLLEKNLVHGRAWPEFQVYPLYSPQSLIAEGTADYAIEAAFPDEQRTAFLREVIFPAAGLDPAQAHNYFEVSRVAEGLAGATIEAARRYRDGVFSKQQAMDFMRQYALASEGRARQRIAFFDGLGAYIVNYSLGRELVRAYLDRRAETRDERWTVFTELISSPRLPSDLAGP